MQSFFFHNLTIISFLGKSSVELAALNEALQDLLDGIQVCVELTLLH